MNDQPKTGWHVDKRVSIGHIITTLTVAVSIVVWMMSLENRVGINTQAIENNRAWIERNNADILDRLDAMTIVLQRMDDKLERLGRD